MSFRLADDAIVEIENAISYSQLNFELGEELNLAVRKAIAEIVADPLRFAPFRGFRSYKLPRYPFRLFFHVIEDPGDVVIHAFAHTSRRPGYWKSRV